MRRVDFRALNKALDFRDVARVLGIDLKGNKALCPFHNERTPSFVFYPDHWHCFGCGESGDYVTLTAKMLCMSNLEAYEWLNDTLSMGFPSPGNARVKQSFRKKQQINYGEWLRSAKFIVADYIRVFNSLQETIYKDKADIAGVELLHDRLLESNDPKEAFTLYGSEVAKIGKRMERYRQLKTIQQLFD
jgi:DNA primase